MNIFNNLFQNSIQDVEYSSEFHSSSNISLGDILIGRFNTLNPDHSAGNRDEQQALFITQRIENVINHDNLMGNSNNNNLNNNNNNITNNFNNISNNGGIIPSPTFPSHSEDISNIETITLRRNQRKYDKDNINKKLKVLFFKTFYSQITLIPTKSPATPRSLWRQTVYHNGEKVHVLPAQSAPCRILIRR